MRGAVQAPSAAPAYGPQVAALSLSEPAMAPMMGPMMGPSAAPFAATTMAPTSAPAGEGAPSAVRRRLLVDTRGSDPYGSDTRGSDPYGHGGVAASQPYSAQVTSADRTPPHPVIVTPHSGALLASVVTCHA